MKLFRDYVIAWGPELIFAAGTFAFYVGTQIVLTDQRPLNGWSDWFVGTSVAGARLALVGLLKPLGIWLAKRRGG